MKIKRLDISGFKSFCDETQITFDNAVTAVVGPNGCGKSNIVDAIRWTLGEMSPKNLRGKAMEDVIFNGSETRGPTSMAEVTITFDNGDGLSHPAYTDFPEVSVTRRLHREGNSEYLINKLPCRLKDISDLILGTGGGPRAYSIIEQGRIGLIISARSEDRRLIIEEAAGITKYKANRRSAERRMDRTRQNLLRINDVVTEMARNLASLNRQAKKAERFKRYRDELTDLELHVASHQYLELSANQVAVDAALKEAEGVHQQISDNLVTLDARQSKLRLDEQAIKTELDERTAQSYELNNKIQIVENEVRHHLETIERLHDEERSLRQHKVTTAEQIEAMGEESTQLVEQQKRIDADRLACKEQHEVLAQEAEQSRVRLKDLAETHDAKRDWLSRTKARLAASNMAIENLSQRQREIEAGLNTARDEQASRDQHAADMRTHLNALEEQSTAVEKKLNAEIAAQEHERESGERLAHQIDTVETELRDVRDALQVKRSRKGSLEEVMGGLERHDRAVRDAVVSLNEDGPELFEGLFLDAIECPARFELALAAVLDSRLQALLVSDRDAGLEILARLKERDVGRVTVLTQNSGTVPFGPTVEMTDRRIIGSLFDFLTVQPQARELTRCLLTSVFVVENLEIATQLWQDNAGRATLVTLDGQVLRADGAMNGGRAGSMGADLLGQKREIRELDEQIVQLAARHDDLAERLEIIKAELEVHNNAAEQARASAQDQAILLAETRKDKNRAIDDLTTLAQRREALETEIAHQEERLVQTRADRERAVAEVQSTTEEIATLEQVIAEQMAQIDVCRSQTDDLSAKTADMRVKQASLDHQWQAVVDRQAQLKQMSRDATERLGRGDEDLCRIFEKIGTTAGKAVLERESQAARLARAEQIRVQITELRQALEAATGATAEAEAELRRMRKEAQNATDLVAELKLQVHQLSIEVRHLLENTSERYDLNLLHVLTDYHLRDLVTDETKARIDELRRLIERMGPINLAAIEEYKSESERHEKLVTQKADLEQALEDLEQAIARMDRDSRRRFKETFEDVNAKFQEIFPRLFKGGRAHLVLTDPEDLLATGVDIVAQPPGKRLSNIELLSGGEKALTAVSLMFAVFLHRPSPFCVLDEVDAPLDEANINRFIDMLREMTDRSQFIMITHSKLTMERSDSLYGVTMEEAGISKMVSVRINPDVPPMVANA